MKPLKLVIQSLFKQFQQRPNLFFYSFCPLYTAGWVQYLENGKNEHFIHGNILQRIFDKLSSDVQVDRLCTSVSLVIDV